MFLQSDKTIPILIGLKNEMNGVVKFQILPWRSLSPRFMRWFVRPQFGGKAFLRRVYWLEERFPRVFGKTDSIL